LIERLSRRERVVAGHPRLAGLLRAFSAASVIVASALVVLFGSEFLINSLGLQFTYVSVEFFHTVHLVILTESVDYQIFLIALVVASLGSIAALLVTRKAIPDVMILTHVVLPVSYVLLSQRIEQRLLETVSPFCLPELGSLALSQMGLDTASTLLSFAALLMVFVTLRYFRYVFGFSSLVASLTALTIVFSAYVFVGSLSLVALFRDAKHFVLFFDQRVADGDVFWRMALLDLNIFSTLYQAAAYLVVVIFASWIWIPVGSFLWKKLRRSGSGAGSRSEAVQESELHHQPTPERKFMNLVPAMLVAISIVIGGYVVYLPYFYQDKLVGVDAPWYLQTLVALNRPQEFWGIVLTEPRAPYLIVLYAIMHVLGATPEVAVKLGPVVVVALAASTSYVLVKSLVNNKYVGAVAAILSALSVQTTAGLTGSIFASWLAFALMMILYALLLSGANSGSRRLLLGAVLVSCLLLFTHAWTWGAFMIVLIVNFILTMVAPRLRGRDDAAVIRRWRVWLVIVIAANAALALAVLSASAFGVSGPAGVSEGYSLLTGLVSPERITRLGLSVDSLAYVMRIYVGGVYTNGVLYALAIVGLFGARKASSPGQYALTSWILVASVLTALADPSLQWRMLYLPPYHILAVLGIFSLTVTFQRLMPETGQRSSRIPLYAIVGSLCVAFLVAQFNYALRSVAELIV